MDGSASPTSLPPPHSTLLLLHGRALWPPLLFLSRLTFCVVLLLFLSHDSAAPGASWKPRETWRRGQGTGHGRESHLGGGHKGTDAQATWAAVTKERTPDGKKFQSVQEVSGAKESIRLLRTGKRKKGNHEIEKGVKNQMNSHAQG